MEEEDERYMPTDGRREGVGKTNLEADANSFLMIDEILETLKLLDYESKFCKTKNFSKLERSYFCKTHTKPQQQFYYFTSLTSWLMGLNNHYYAPPAQFDDPNTTSSSILLELRKMGITIDFPAPKIRIGYGEAVLSVLKALTDLCMKKIIRFGTVAHRPDGYADEITGDTENEAAADIADEVGDVYGGDDELFPDDTKKPQELPDDVLVSRVDPNAWKIELERVRPLLKLTIQADSREWRSHLESMTTNQDAIAKNMTGTSGSLEKFGNEILKVLEKIQARENTLNSQFNNLILDFRHSQAKLNETNERYKNSSVQITAYTNELSRVSDELDTTKRQMEELSTSISDATPVTKIKAALSSIKGEIKMLDLKIGVSSSSLLQYRLRDKHARPNMRKKKIALDASYDEI